MKATSLIVLALALTLSVAASASADFTGQLILGPLSNPSLVNGDTTSANDDNDGWDSGTHIFDLWNGPDDVYILPWAGGNIELEMTYAHEDFFFDLDLFLYEPGQLDSTGNYSILSTGVENIEYLDAPAGDYYIVVDGYNGSAGAYTLNVTPEPGSIALLGLGIAAIASRRRRA